MKRQHKATPLVWAVSPIGRRHVIERDELGVFAACGRWRPESWEVLCDVAAPECPWCSEFSRPAPAETYRGEAFYGERRGRIERLLRLGVSPGEIAAAVEVETNYVHVVASRLRRKDSARGKQ